MGSRRATQLVRARRRSPDRWGGDRTERRQHHPARRSRHAALRWHTAIALAATAVLLSGCLGPVTRLEALPAGQFPETSDPSVVRVGGTYYVYGSNNHLRAPVFVTDDLTRSYTLSEKNARTTEGMPTKPPWAASNTQLWAPTVAQFGRRWVMFFSADRVSPPQPDNPQCVGRAWANGPTGPFVAESAPVHCGLGGTGGALDPEITFDKWGNPFLLVAFGNTESPLHGIPLDADANLAGAPVAILRRQHPWEYHFIEQPSMIYDPARDSYVLTYSAGRWWEAGYSTGIARCLSPTGPCVSDPTGPWVAASNGRTGPGGLSFFRDADGAARAIFSTFPAGGETTNGGRSASVMYVRFDPSMALSVVK